MTTTIPPIAPPSLAEAPPAATPAHDGDDRFASVLERVGRQAGRPRTERRVHRDTPTGATPRDTDSPSAPDAPTESEPAHAASTQATTDSNVEPTASTAGAVAGGVAVAVVAMFDFVADASAGGAAAEDANAPMSVGEAAADPTPSAARGISGNASAMGGANAGVASLAEVAAEPVVGATATDVGPKAQAGARATAPELQTPISDSAINAGARAATGRNRAGATGAAGVEARADAAAVDIARAERPSPVRGASVPSSAGPTPAPDGGAARMGGAPVLETNTGDKPAPVATPAGAAAASAAHDPRVEPITAPARGAAASAAPPTSPSLPDQVITVLTPLRARPDGSYELRLELKPPELGRVEVRVEMRDGVLHAHLRAEQPAAAQALRDALGQLRDQLTDNGVSAGTLDVDTGSKGWLARQQATHQPDERTAASDTANPHPEPGTPGAVPIRGDRGTGGNRLDVRV